MQSSSPVRPRDEREKYLLCPICQKRKAKRFCPAKAETICTICCGTEREVTIDCPSDCPYLIASRQHHVERGVVDWEKMPFPDQRIPYSVLEIHEPLFMSMAYQICEYAAENPSLVDSDVEGVYHALAETYQTLSKGILYEDPPAQRLRRGLYEKLRAEADKYTSQKAGGLVAGTSVRDSEIRDALILFTQIAAGRSNGRPKGRAFMDYMRSQFKPGTFAQTAPKIILAP